MNPRPSRSSSIPIPRSTSASNSTRNIENVLAIPSIASPPNRYTPSTSVISAREPRRVGLSAEGPRAPSSGTGYVSISPTRSTVRSASLATSIPPRSSSRSTYEPRVVRGTGSDIPSTADPDCGPQISTSPSQVRRASGSSLRASGLQKPIVPLHVVSRTTPVAFPRPAYLNYSSLRHLLQTEAPILPIPTRQVEVASQSTSRAHTYSALSDEDDDSEISSSPPTRQSQIRIKPPTTIPQDKILKLPTRWSDQERHSQLNVSPDGRELSFQGPSGNLEKDAAAARTINFIPPACGIYYYEVEVVAKDQKSHISVGFAGKGVRFGRLPGWEPNSWGYYGDDGTSLAPDKSSSHYGQPYGAGDIIGCGIDFITHKAFYTRNGVLIGSVFDNVGKNIDELYPSVGLQQTGESIRANFGQEPFKFDIEYHVQQQYNATWNKISETPLNRSILQGHRRGGFSIASITNDVGVKPSLTQEESKHVLNQLIKTYLIHHGYAKTARALETQQRGRDKAVRSQSSATDAVSGERDVEMNPGPSASDAVDIDIESRTNIVNAILQGNIDVAINSIQTHYPSVLELDDRLMLFKLRCRKFVELILETTEMKKKIKALREKVAERNRQIEARHYAWLEEEMNMDIDDDASAPLMIRSMAEDNDTMPQEDESLEIISSQYESALNEAIFYGQDLSDEYKAHPKPEVQDLFKMTFGIVAWDDPTEAAGPVADLVSHEARIHLAHQINETILRSQGRPAQPALETVYRHTAACITQLGLLGVGAAAFADLRREFFPPAE